MLHSSIQIQTLWSLPSTISGTDIDRKATIHKNINATFDLAHKAAEYMKRNEFNLFPESSNPELIKFISLVYKNAQKKSYKAFNALMRSFGISDIKSDEELKNWLRRRLERIHPFMDQFQKILARKNN